MPTKNILKTNLYEKGIWREILSPENLSRFFSTNTWAAVKEVKKCSHDVM